MQPVLLALIGLYQRVTSTWTAGVCRFEPSCSEYARQAVARYGAWKGAWLALRRVASCHPFGRRGYDPVP